MFVSRCCKSDFHEERGFVPYYACTTCGMACDLMECPESKKKTTQVEFISESNGDVA